MDDENASCAHDGEEDTQLSLLHLPVEVCTGRGEKKKNDDVPRLTRHPREIPLLLFFLIAAVISFSIVACRSKVC